MKKIYQITFKAALTEDDVKAMNKYFYDTMNEYMEIEDLWDLELKEDKDAKSIREFNHISEVEDALYKCKNAYEINELLDHIPRKFGEWWVDIVLNEKGMGYYEVTNEWFDTNTGVSVKTYDLEIEVEEEYL